MGVVGSEVGVSDVIMTKENMCSFIKEEMDGLMGDVCISVFYVERSG